MDSLTTSQWLGIAAVAATALSAYRKRSLDNGGIAAAIIVGTIHALHPARLLALLLVFFYAGTKLTKAGDAIKRERLSSTHDAHSSTRPDSKKRPPSAGKAGDAVATKNANPPPPRTAVQVFANSGIATVLILLHMLLYGSNMQPFGVTAQLSDLLVYGACAQYACSAADTFSSELGVLNDDWPLSITTLRKVPPGTNGGVSVLGTIAACLGGALIGVVAAVVVPCDGNLARAYLVVSLTVVGLFGSLADSFLGATLQQTVYDAAARKVVEVHGGGRHAAELVAKLRKEQGEKAIVMGHDVLDNNQVNLLSCALAVAVGVSWLYATAAVFGAS